MEGIILITEVHRAKWTDAETYFKIPREQVIRRAVEPAFGSKSHWREFFLLRGPTRVKGVRVSNKGNVRVRWFNVEKDTYISFLLNEYEPSDEDLEVAKHLLGLE